MKKFISDFKAFISKGNIVDLAVAVIIGAAFGKIVSSLVSDIITPLIVLAVGKHSLSELAWTIRAAVVENGVIVREALVIHWGVFMQNIVDFLVISLVVFTFVRLVTRVKTTGEKIRKNTKKLIESTRLFNHEEADTKKEEQTAAGGIAAEEAALPAAEPVIAETVIAGETVKGANDFAAVEELLTQIRDLLKEK